MRLKMKYFPILLFVVTTPFGFNANSSESSSGSLPRPGQPPSLPADIKAKVDTAEGFMLKKEYDKVVETLRPVSDRLNRKGLLLLAQGYAAQKSYLNEIRTLEMLLGQNDKDYFVQHK